VDALIKKLQIKDSHRGKIVNAPADMKKHLAAWPKALLTRASNNLDYVLVFTGNAGEIRKQTSGAVRQVREDGMIWFAYPKQSSGVKTDINRDYGWEPLSKLGFRGVRQISIDSVWSAIRFREKSRVK